MRRRDVAFFQKNKMTIKHVHVNEIFAYFYNAYRFCTKTYLQLPN